MVTVLPLKVKKEIVSSFKFGSETDTVGFETSATRLETDPTDSVGPEAAIFSK